MKSQFHHLATLLVVLQILTTIASHATSATLTFPSASSCNTTLQACIDSASPSDIVEVATSSPVGEDLFIDKSLTLRAAAGFSPVLDDVASVVLYNSETKSNSIVFEGFTLNLGFVQATQRSALPFDVRVRNNVFTDTYNDRSAIEIENGFEGPYGVVTFDISDNVITIPDAYFAINAIAVNGGHTTTTQGTIRNNKIVQLGGGQSSGIFVANNFSELKVDVIGNHVSGANMNSGISFFQFGDGMADIRIVNNFVEGQVDEAGQPAGIGIAATEGDTEFLILNNTVVNSEHGIAISGDSQVGATWSGVVANNIVANMSEWGITIDDPTTVVNEHNLVFNADDNYFIPGPHTLFVDPEFVGSSDYHLMPGSPAQNAGNNARMPLDIHSDIEGSPRIQGWAVDLGAYEIDVPEPGTVGLACLAVTAGGMRVARHRRQPVGWLAT
jgi:hypothetical protein